MASGCRATCRPTASPGSWAWPTGCIRAEQPVLSRTNGWSLRPSRNGLLAWRLIGSLGARQARRRASLAPGELGWACCRGHSRGGAGTASLPSRAVTLCPHRGQPPAQPCQQAPRHRPCAVDQPQLWWGASRGVGAACRRAPGLPRFVPCIAPQPWGCGCSLPRWVGGQECHVARCLWGWRGAAGG